MEVKHFKMETAALVAALLLAALLPSVPAQDVRAVDHYISDTAPVAGIGVGEVVPARNTSPKRTGTQQNSRIPDSNSRGNSHISKETEQTISYVEDVLAGRIDVSKGVQDSVFEPSGRGNERPKPVTSSGYSRVDAPSESVHGSSRDGPRDTLATHSRDDRLDSGTLRRPDEGGTRSAISGIPRETTRNSGTGYSREDSQPATPSRVVPQESGLPRRHVENGVRIGVENGSPREGSRKPTASELPRGDRRDSSVPVRSQDGRTDSNVGYDGGSSRGGLSGSSRGDDRGGSVPERRPQDGVFGSAGNTREEGPVYKRKEQVATSGVHAPQGSHSGNSRKEVVIDPDVDDSRDSVVTPSRDSVLGRDRDTVVDRPRDNAFGNSRGTSAGHSRDDAFDHSRVESVGHTRNRVVENSQGSVYDSSRRTTSEHSLDTVAGHSRDTPIVDHSRDTGVDHSRETLVDHSLDSDSDYSRETHVHNSRDDIETPHRTTAVNHRESSPANSWDTYEINEEKSERDGELSRSQEYPNSDSVEEPIYTSKEVGEEESAFGFDREEYEEDEDIEVAHSSRPLPKSQKPRQVTANPTRRGARGPHPASPCPSVFSYEGTRAGKERWYGVVLVTTDETLTGLRLEIRLDKRADLLGTWLGEVSSVDNIRYTIWNGRRKVEPGPPLSVKIFVKYNEQEYEPPRVRSIRLNGRQICPKEKVTTAVIPKPSIKPPPRPNHPVSRPTQGSRPIHRPTRPGNAGAQTPNVRPPQKPVQPALSGQSTGQTELVDGVACGRIEVQPSPLITYGQRTARGQWPWHAAIYQSKGTDLSYICGGSLIGKRTILTAAHCVSRRYIDRPVDPESLVVYLGKYHLKLWSEGGVQDKQVLEVHVHPEYNSTDFRADIAILILSSPVEFTVYVKPICLWDKNRPDLNEVEGHEGVVVGWGYDERGMVTEDLMMAKMPVVSQETCIWSYPQFFSHFTSDRTYCAGFRNGTSVCNGDSGGGMVFPKSTGIAAQGSTITWALRGLVSLSTSQANKRVCNTDHYVVFTDVVKFYDWMKKYH